MPQVPLRITEAPAIPSAGAKVAVTMDEDSGDPEANSQNYTQRAIHSTYV